MKVLVVRLSSIGDIVLTTPVLRILKEQKQDVEIHYIVLSKFKATIEFNPHITKIWEVTKSINEVLPLLKDEKFDFVIDLHNNLRSAKIRKAISAPSSIVNKLNIKKWLMVNSNYSKPIPHIVERYIATLSPLQLEDDSLGLDFHIAENQQVALETINLEEDKYIAWVIGAKYAGKHFSLEKHYDVLRQFDQRIVLLGGEAEVKAANHLVDRLGDNITSVVGEYSIHQSASVIAQSKMVVTPDTGLMHIAAAFKKNMVSIWGCTTPEIGMAPYRPGEKSIMIQPENLKRRPCSKLGNRCKYKGGCINRISAEVLHREVLSIYNT